MHYSCEYYECDAPDNCCLFCRHCTDVFWDYTHGPYLFLGDAPGCNGDWKSCGSFEPEVLYDE